MNNNLTLHLVDFLYVQAFSLDVLFFYFYAPNWNTDCRDRCYSPHNKGWHSHNSYHTPLLEKLCTLMVDLPKCVYLYHLSHVLQQFCHPLTS